MLAFLPLAASGGPPVPPAATTFFQIGPLPVTSSMIAVWGVAALIVAVVTLGTRRMALVPTGSQNLVEAVVDGVQGMLSGLLEPKVVRWALPLIGTYFIFILLSNLVDLLPGVGSIGYGHAKEGGLPFAVDHVERPLLRPPTADANLTVAMAVIYFVMSTFWALRFNGPVGLVKHIFGVKGKIGGFLLVPMAVIFFIVGIVEVISIMIRPVSLSMRLYGNIYGGENVLTLMLKMLPGGIAAVPFYFLELIVCVVQAIVFTMLCVAFTATLCSHSDDEGGHH
ncbi:MAG: ATP synthase F0 subunit A [Betaproteobacteria bacterium]|jgi:F-type H+-transporting ATPase subunit a|nr:ATP synthase F0 subunit A [Betaproteobacteria bacterium]